MLVPAQECKHCPAPSHPRTRFGKRRGVGGASVWQVGPWLGHPRAEGVQVAVVPSATGPSPPQPLVQLMMTGSSGELGTLMETDQGRRPCKAGLSLCS